MSYVTNLLSGYYGILRISGSQHCVAEMLENWKSYLDESESVCGLFMDLSKVLDSINHDLSLAKVMVFLKMHWL